MPAPDRPRLGQLGEDEVLRQVLGRYPGAPRWLRVPPGDDAAVLDLAAFGGEAVVAAMDTVVEGRDFVREWSTGVDVGVKIAAQNFADIAAMGARPVALLVSLTAPGDLPVAFATDLADGLAAECARAGAVVAGGDLSDGDSIVVSATALGAVVSGVVRRSGAGVGDTVALAGALGASAAGLALLQAGITELDEATTARLQAEGTGHDEAAAAVAWALAAHRRPAPPYRAGPAAAAAGATAMIDVSDGLVRDAGRVAVASGVVIDLRSDLLLADPTPADPRLAVVATVLQDPALVGEWLMTGGEDHALLACFAPQTLLPPPFRPIGVVSATTEPQPAPAERQTTVRLDGRRWSGPPGWHHWPIATR
jgi:thiamine-monophosphate kinase